MPAAEGIPDGHFVGSPVQAGHHEPAPRRLRGRVAGEWVFDTLVGHYLWDHPYYPQYAVPRADVTAGLLEATDETVEDAFGTWRVHTVPSGSTARVLEEPLDPALADLVRFDRDAIDAWFEEDQEITGHPRSPFVLVDAIRSSRRVTVRHGDRIIADAASCVIVFETGLPPRFYLDRSAVDFGALEPSSTRTFCPYKGETTDYWSLRAADGSLVEDVAWSYGFPFSSLAPIAGLVCFDDTVVAVDTSP